MLNSIQSKKLADFFFDIAKGLILGGLGFSTVVPGNLKIFYALFSAVFAYLCIQLGLKILTNIE